MKLIKLTFCLLVILAVVIVGLNTHAQTVSPQGELVWKNGDKAPGQIVSADHSRLQWLAPELFRDPLDLELAFLDRVDFKQGNAVGKTAEMYSIQTIDGFSLYGTVSRLDGNWLEVSSPRFGDVKVDRSRIATILNLATSGSLIHGEFDLAKWSSDRGEKKFWTVNDQGQLESQRSDIHLYLKSELSESALIEVEFRWTRKLDFTFGFGVPRNTRNIELLPRLESWDDSIVLSHNDDFEIVLEANDSESKRLKLLIHWDRKTNLVVIHDERGKPLATADIGVPSRSIEPGIFIQNKTGDLSIASMMIRRSSAGFDATQASVQILEEAAINGRIESFDGSVWTVETNSESAENLKIPDEKFCGAFLINPPMERAPAHSRLIFYDGMQVGGELESIGNGAITLKTGFLGDPVSLQLVGASRLRFEVPLSAAAAERFSHKLFNAAGQIQGRLEPGSGQADDILRWRVAGAVAAVPFSQGNSRIVLNERQAIVPVDAEWGDTLYLVNCDTIPCNIISIDGQHVTIDSFTENKQIDQELIRAIDFRRGAGSGKISTDDEAWVIPEASKKLVRATADKMTISKDAVFEHPWLLSTGGFEFDLAWNGGAYGVLECQLFCGTEGAADPGKRVNIVLYGGNVFVSDTGEARPANRTVEVRGNTARIGFRYEKGKLFSTIDGKDVWSGVVGSESFQGRGVVFRLNDMYQQGIGCTVSKFELRINEAGSGSNVDPVRKSLLLTIPRLKKATPPKQVLCATNSDMVRGDIVSLDKEHIVFRANNEDKRFPKTVIGSIVWLHAEDLAKEPSASEGDRAASDPGTNPKENSFKPETREGQTVQILMQGDRRMTSTLQSWTDEKLIGSSPALGKCEIPLEQITELRFGSYATQATDIPYADWVATLAPAPMMENGAEGEEGSSLAFGSASPMIGTTAKPFIATMLDETKFSLKDAKGKVVILDFWATWCGPCVQALPGVIEVTGSFSPEDVVFVAVNQEETVEQIRSFLASRKLEFPIALDSGEIGKQFQVESIPQTVIIDRDGKIAFVKVGNSADNDKKIRVAIDQLLAPIESAAPADTAQPGRDQ